MSQVKVKELTKEIKDNLSQKSASQKDEVKVMQAMLNDRDYKVGVYDRSGKIDEYCPAAEARVMVASIINATTKVSKDEASVLAEDHNFSRAEAAVQVGLAKEFVNTYLETGRKLPLGGRETSNISIIGKDVDASTTRYPKKVGVADDGTAIYESAEKMIPAHTSARVSAPCPEWVNK